MANKLFQDSNLNETLFKEEDFSLIQRTPLYFGHADKPLMGWLHSIKSNLSISTQNKAVIICQPLGLDYMNAYRSMRFVADYFALAGIPAFRFDYHGTGDSSGSNLDHDRIPDWLESIQFAQKKVVELTGQKSIGLFGFRLGGTLASLASERNNFDFMILWSAIEKGSRFLREIKALQKTSSIIEQAPSDLLEAGGTVYWNETKTSISQISLLNIKPKVRNILIIPRDDIPSNGNLKDCWSGKSIDCEQIPLTGSSNMLIDAHLTKVPHKSIETLVNWVMNIETSEPTPTTEISVTNKTIRNTQSFEFNTDDPECIDKKNFKIRESFFYFGKDKTHFSIKTESKIGYDSNLPIIILTNSGSNHRVGPSRLYVQLARQWAQHGFLVYRIDLPGLGDSMVKKREDENIEYLDKGTNCILKAIDDISQEYKQPRFVVAGLCSGAYFSFQTALNSDHSNIVEILLINPLTFYWERGQTPEYSPTRSIRALNWYKQAFFDVRSWKKLFSGNTNYGYLIKTIHDNIRLKLRLKFGQLNRFDSNQSNSKIINGSSYERRINNLGDDLESIVKKDTRISFLFARSDPGYDLLTTLGGKKTKSLIKGNKITMQFVENADHTFSKFKPRRQAIELLLKHLIESYKRII